MPHPERRRLAALRRFRPLAACALASATGLAAFAAPLSATPGPQPASQEPASQQAAPQQTASIETPIAPRLSDEAKARIVSAVRTAAGRAQYRGAFLVVIGDDAILSSGRGVRIPDAPADSDGTKPINDASIFEIASIAKPFTAIAILQLVEEGKIDLDAPITQYLVEDLKDLPDANTSQAAKITVRQMLSHQTGLNNDGGIARYDEPSRKAAVAKFFGSEVLAQPGTRFDYNNAAYCILAAIIENVTGEAFEAHMRARIFDPARMTSTGFPPGTDLDQSQRVRRKGNFAFHDHPWGWGYRGCGGILTTPRDIVAFAKALDSGQLISADSLALMYQPGKPAGSRTPNATYGLGWFIETRDGMLRASHSGGSFGCRAHMVRYPNQRVTIAAFTDDTANPFGITDAAEAALLEELKALRAQDAATPPAPATP